MGKKTNPDSLSNAYRYAHDDLPPVSNYVLYWYRIFIKLICFSLFGTGSVLLAVIIFPPMRLFCRTKDGFRHTASAFVSAAFRFFVWFMEFFRVVQFTPDSRNKYRNLHSCIITANHPSLLDVVFIISLVPDADCIVRGGLTKGILAGVIRQLYITNTLDYETLKADCIESLHSGSCLIIFPEGTRTPRHGVNPYKKGAARISLASGCPIVPLYIGGTDKFGLGKHDPMLAFNHTDKYIYTMTMLPQLDPASYRGLPEPVAAKHMTQDLRAAIDSVSQ